MPFKGVKHEAFMMINKPTIWKRWVNKYGHAKGWAAARKRAARKGGRSRRGRKGRKHS